MTPSTFLRVCQRIGGLKTAIICITAQFTLHYLEVYVASQKSQWANIEEQKDFNNFLWATASLLCMFLLSFAIGVGIEVILTNKISSLS